MADDLETLRKKKMMEYLSRQQNPEAQQAMQKQAELENHLKKLMLALLERDAMTRLNTIKATKPEFALQVEMGLFQLFQAGRIKPPVSDAQLKHILNQFVPDKKETKITRR
jgi:programmed cell death protein 5